MEKGLELIEIKKSYPGVNALKGISFKINKNSVHGLLGPNGAGKSTTMNIIAGVLRPSAGRIEYSGFESERPTLGLLSETPPLYPQMRVNDYLNFVAEIFGLKKSEKKERVQFVLNQCKLEEFDKRFIGTLSKGLKQRVGLAQAIVHNPEIIILDEPTSGLDPIAIKEIRDLIYSLKDSHTLILSSHILPEVQLLCSDITIINKGQIYQSGSMESIQKLFQADQVIFAKLKSWDEEKEKSFREKFPDNSLEIDREKSELKILSRSGKDDREKLGEFFVNTNCGLLSFSEKKLDLEEIFQEATKETNLQ